MGFGVQELVIVFMAGLVYLIPIAIIIVIFVMLNRLRKGQETIKTRLDAIEQTIYKDR
jgi:positive regulator of sigma E activity